MVEEVAGVVVMVEVAVRTLHVRALLSRRCEPLLEIIMVQVTRLRNSNRARQRTHVKKIHKANKKAVKKRPCSSSSIVATDSQKSLKQRSRASNRNSHCAWCGLYTFLCMCSDVTAPRGKLSLKKLNEFLDFKTKDNRRRYLTDCLDVVLLRTWFQCFLSDGGSVPCAILAVLMFRHFNRVSTWEFIVEAFDARRSSPNWSALDFALRSSNTGLHKPFSRPVIVLDADGNFIGTDTVENAVLTFKAVWIHVRFKSMCQLLQEGVSTVAQYELLISCCSDIRGAFPGAFGTYRLKNNLDVWLDTGMISKSAINWWPVALNSGTCNSLSIVYRTKISTERQGEQLLIHLYHQARSHNEYKSKSDSIATLSLNLCGWHRSKYFCRYDDHEVSGLDRAIRLEEVEYLELRRVLRE